MSKKNKQNKSHKVKTEAIVETDGRLSKQETDEHLYDEKEEQIVKTESNPEDTDEHLSTQKIESEEIKTDGNSSQQNNVETDEHLSENDIKTDNNPSEQETETFNTIEPDKIIEVSENDADIDIDSCEKFLKNVFDQYENVDFVMAKTIDGITFQVMALDRDKIPAKNSQGYIILSSLEMHDVISNIFTKTSESRNVLRKNIIVLINKSIKVSIFVNGIEDFSISNKNINEF